MATNEELFRQLVAEIGSEYGDQIEIVAKILGAERRPDKAEQCREIAAYALKALADAGYVWSKGD